MRRTIIFLIIILLCFSNLPTANAGSASLYLSPSSGNYTVNNTFSVVGNINTGGVSINAAQGTLVFSPDKLSVVGISKGGSVFSLWTTEPTYSNSLGTISFGGGIPSPGYSGSAGKIITITFKARVSGTASVNWSSGAVLANDGKGTNILTNMNGGKYDLKAVVSPAEAGTISIKAPVKPDIVSSTHPEENKWYSDSTVEFSWEMPKNVTGVSIRFDQKPVSNPGPLSDGLFNSKTYKDVDDGIWYLHLKLRNEYGWGDIEHFRVQIDITPRPQITNYPKRLSLGDTLILEGTSLPNAVIRCYIQKEDDKAVIGETSADENGKWVYVHDKSLGRGLYKIYPVAADKIEGEGHPGLDVVVAVTLPAFLKIGSIAIDYLTVIVVLLILIGIMIFGAYWAWHKFKLFKKHLRKETKEVESTLHRALELLKERVINQLKKIDGIKGKRKLTKKEEEIEKQLKKELNVVEGYVKEELKDIEKKLTKEELE